MLLLAYVVVRLESEILLASCMLYLVILKYQRGEIDLFAPLSSSLAVGAKSPTDFKYAGIASIKNLTSRKVHKPNI